MHSRTLIGVSALALAVATPAGERGSVAAAPARAARAATAPDPRDSQMAF